MAAAPTRRVLISIDMEGVAGIATRRQVIPGQSDYETGRRLMTAEANAAIAGAFEGGATEVVVADSHGPMDNLIGDDLDERAEYVVGSPRPLSMVAQAERGVAAALFIGYHGGFDEADGVLAHTYSGKAFTDVRVNGGSVTEMEVNALVAAERGVPVALVTGDDLTCAVAEKRFPGVATVAVKRALGRTAARSLTPTAACGLIRAAAARAVEQADSLSAVPIPDELTLEVDVRISGAAEYVEMVPGSTRVGVNTVRASCGTPTELLRLLVVWSHLATVPTIP